MIPTCGQYEAETQEGERTDWPRVELHFGDKRSVRRMLLFYTLAPPPPCCELGFPNQETPHGTFPSEIQGLRN